MLPEPATHPQVVRRIGERQLVVKSGDGRLRLHLLGEADEGAATREAGATLLHQNDRRHHLPELQTCPGTILLVCYRCE